MKSSDPKLPGRGSRSRDLHAVGSKYGHLTPICTPPIFFAVSFSVTIYLPTKSTRIAGMPSQKRKVCAFCQRDDQEITKEYVVPKWILKLLPKEVESTLFRPDGTRIASWKLGDSSLMVNNVCKSCNQGWMEQTEEKRFVCQFIHTISWFQWLLSSNAEDTKATRKSRIRSPGHSARFSGGRSSPDSLIKWSFARCLMSTYGRQA
jgi:hypothetical protein